MSREDIQQRIAEIDHELRILHGLCRYAQDSIGLDQAGADQTLKDLDRQIKESADIVRGQMALLGRDLLRAGGGR